VRPALAGRAGEHRAAMPPNLSGRASQMKKGPNGALFRLGGESKLGNEQTPAREGRKFAPSDSYSAIRKWSGENS
jgi:hypothetical protein